MERPDLPLVTERVPDEHEVPSPDDVLAFWFGPSRGADGDAARPEWFGKDPAFDALIAERFGGLLIRALHGRLEADPAVRDAVDTRLARILVCDQFARNAWRDRPAAFALDPVARATAQTLIGSAAELAMPVVRRWFLYMPLMHSEDLADQQRSVTLFEALAAESALVADAADYARRHRDVIARFGRFPHRNEILGRSSTEEEISFLKQPGSRF
ncbi:MAG: DUF924 family protein [Lautropia sp.]